MVKQRHDTVGIPIRPCVVGLTFDWILSGFLDEIDLEIPFLGAKKPSKEISAVSRVAELT